MNRPNPMRLAVLAAVFLAAGVPLAEAATPLTPEIRVNQAFAGDQRYPQVAAAADGSFVVVWESEVGGRSVTDILARRYSASGQALGNEFVVNTTTANRQVLPALAMNSAGDFIVAWNSLGQNRVSVDIYAQRFNADGSRRGGELHVNDGRYDPAAHVGVAMNDAGEFVLVWPERKTLSVAVSTAKRATVNARLYAADGTPKGSQIELDSSIPTNYRIPVVGMLADGSFTAAWQSDITQALPLDTSTVVTAQNGILLERYSAAGQSLGPAVQVDQSPSPLTGLPLLTGAQPFPDRPAIAVTPEGECIVAWSVTAFDLTPQGVFARRYDAAGQPRGPVFQVGSGLGALSTPAVAIDASGKATVIAHGNGVFGEQIAATDPSSRQPLTIVPTADANAVVPNSVLNVGVAVDARGRLVTVWQDYGRDGDGRGIIARVFQP